MLAGLAIAVYRRFLSKGRRPLTSAMDRYVMVILAVILVSGVFLEATKMVSHTIYLEMVEEYAGPQDEATLNALEAYWVEDFALASPTVQGPFDAETLQQGKIFHQTACLDCHARPLWAFLSYGVARIGKPLATPLEPANLRTILFYLHFWACCGGLAYLPFSKLFHMFASPLSLMLNAVMEKGRSDPANLAPRQIIELDACMHCGSCTLRCAVAVAFEEIPNVNILPLEKIASIKALAAGRQLSIDQLRIIQQGMTLCTNCYRCTLACPAGINLQDLWFSVRETLLQHYLPEMLLLSPLSLLRGLMQESNDPKTYLQPLEQAREAINVACHLEQLHDRTVPKEPEDARLLKRNW
jgi:heterodisulfide reductase subunit C